MSSREINPFEFNAVETPPGHFEGVRESPPAGIMVIAIVYLLFGGFGVLGFCGGVSAMAIQGLVQGPVVLPNDGGTRSVAVANGDRFAAAGEDYQRAMEQWAESFQPPMWWTAISMLLGLAVSVLMITAGIGLLKHRLWGARFGVWASYSGIANYVITAIATCFMGPQMFEAFRQMPTPAGSEMEGFDTFITVLGVVYVIFVAGYLIVFGVAYFMIAKYLQRPHVLKHLT